MLVVRVESLKIRADRDLLRRVLENLLDNALRHAPHGTSVKVESSNVPDEASLTRLLLAGADEPKSRA